MINVYRSSKIELSSSSGAPVLDDRLKRIREVIQVLPRAHFYLLQRLVEHFEKCVQFSLSETVN